MSRFVSMLMVVLFVFAMLNAYAEPVAGNGTEIEDETPVEILKASAAYTNKTHNDVTFTWSDDHSVCHVEGVKSSKHAFVGIGGSQQSMAFGMQPGKTYTVKFTQPADESVRVRLLPFDANGEEMRAKDVICDIDYTVPADAAGLIVRFITVGDAGTSVCTDVVCPEIWTKASTEPPAETAATEINMQPAADSGKV